MLRMVYHYIGEIQLHMIFATAPIEMSIRTVLNDKLTNSMLLCCGQPLSNNLPSIFSPADSFPRPLWFLLLCFEHPPCLSRFPFSSQASRNGNRFIQYEAKLICRSVSFNLSLCFLFMDAFRTTAFRPNFQSRSSYFNIVDILRWIMRSSL